MPIVNEAERLAAVVAALLARVAHLEANIPSNHLEAAANRLRLRVLATELLEAQANLADYLEASGKRTRRKHARAFSE